MKAESRSVLVVGAGAAGMSSALELANAGFYVHLLEREAVVGGHAASFPCKATDICAGCSACVVSDKIREVVHNPRIRLLTSSTMRGLRGGPGDFRVRIVQEPSHVDAKRCVACGLCTEVCPTDPKAIYMPQADAVPLAHVLDERLCLRWHGKKCELCREVCPTEAIAFDRKQQEEELTVGAIVVATGFQVFDAREKGSLGYGRYPNVLTGLDLEHIFRREGALRLPGGDKEPDRIAFIQCIGSRDEGHVYCSHVCCKYAMKFAALIKHQRPDAQVTIFYIDLQTAGKGFARFFEQYKADIRFVRGVPVEIVQTASGELEVKFEDISLGHVGRDAFDLVVLSVGISPRRDSWDLARVLGIDMAEDGFFDTATPIGSNETSVSGIFLAGTCQGPKDIPDSVAHGTGAASKVMELLGMPVQADG
ncbi:MAG: FAD-dependent oxidoreductase [Dehalococcoidia bacterium]